MKKSLKDRLFKRSMWTLLAVFFALIMIIFIIATPITKQYEMFVDQFFGATRKQPLANDNSNPADWQYYTSEFATKDENGKYITSNINGVETQVLDFESMRAHSMAIAKQVNEEGMTLLWNNNKALPLKKGDKISTFGIGSVDWIYSGIGSGKVDIGDNTDLIDVKAILTSDGVGLKLNEDCIKSVETGQKKGYGVNYYEANEIPWKDYSSTAKNKVSQFGDAAVYVISRYFGEGFDSSAYTSTSDDGDKLSLSRAEYSVIEGLTELKKQNKLKKIILVINVAGPLNLKGVDQSAVDACLWVGCGGYTSVLSFADVLVGNSYPSGHLPDTWAYDLKSAPATKNWTTKYSSVPTGMPTSYNEYIAYQEGIYVGYRYYETRYEDTVLGKGNATDPAGGLMNTTKWSYTDEIAFPFGYGVSYTTFSYSNYKVSKSGKNYNVSVTVTNTGDVAGKDAVQIYLQKPYTEYDVSNKIEKAAVELVGYAKTPEIAPGATATVTITVPEYEFKSYDSYGKGTYILEKGDYYLAVGENSHDALNNILAAKGKTTSDGMDYNGKANLAEKITYQKDDFETYSKSVKGVAVVNQFDIADVNRNKGMEQSVTYLSRNDWKGTFPSAVSLEFKGEENLKLVQLDKDVPNNPEDEMPIYGTVTSEYGALTLVMLKDFEYDDPIWDDLLNQLTFDEQENLLRSCASDATVSIVAPGIRQDDGPMGLRGTKMGFPSNTIVAATFNGELQEQLGIAFGTEMLNAGWGGVYGLGANIHRTPWGGRAFEYYSEDGFLTGRASSDESKGMRQMGVILYTKHFLLNDQDTGRDNGSMVWANEQTIREIYLKAFETSIIEGYCNGLMTAYSRIGPSWSGQNEQLLTNVLRKEWGFTGITITDFVGTHAFMGGNNSSLNAFANIAGQDGWMTGYTPGALKPYYEAKNATVCLAVRESAHRILYTQLHSLMMNGVSADTIFINVTPGWEKALLAVKIVAGVFMGLCLAMVAASWALWYIEKQKSNNN